MKATERNISLTDATYAAIVKRYEDTGDVQNADIIRRQWEAARASASAHQKPAETRMDAVSHAGARRVRARPADPLIAVMTWRKRIGVSADYPLHAPTDVERAMVAEIAELRARIVTKGQSERLVQRTDDFGHVWDATPEQAAEIDAAQACRSSEKVQAEQDAREIAEIWDAATANAAMYVEAHCVDGEMHAEAIMNAKRPTIRSANGDPVDLAALAPRAVSATLAEEVLATILWLYRRLPRCYGRPPVVERPILALAEKTGIDVADCLAERGPAPDKANEDHKNGVTNERT